MCKTAAIAVRWTNESVVCGGSGILPASGKLHQQDDNSYDAHQHQSADKQNRSVFTGGVSHFQRDGCGERPDRERRRFRHPLRHVAGQHQHGAIVSPIARQVASRIPVLIPAFAGGHCDSPCDGPTLQSQCGAAGDQFFRPRRSERIEMLMRSWAGSSGVSTSVAARRLCPLPPSGASSGTRTTSPHTPIPTGSSSCSGPCG